MSDHHAHHRAENHDRAFALGLFLNLLFVLVEAGYGWASSSLSLVADAGHNLSDVFSLLLAWGAAVLARRAPGARRTYGFRKGTILASLISAVMLLVALGGIAWEAVRRFASPQPVESLPVIMVAAIGVVINTATALLFLRGQEEDLNIRGAFLHMAADAGISLGVVIAGLVMMQTGWLWVDPLVSLLIVAAVLVGTWSLLRDSLDLILDAVPPGVDLLAVRHYLLELEGVEQLHHLHIWPLSTTEVALSVHLVIAEGATFPSPTAIQHVLHDRFGIDHATVQFERQDGEPCLLDGVS